MLRLANDFYITSIDRSKYIFEDSLLIQSKNYTFRYKEYKIDVEIKFTIIGHIKEDTVSIVNFVYDLDIRRWSNKEQKFKYFDLDNKNGQDTKKYFDSKEARELVLRFIERDVDKYLQKTSPAIIVRGPLSELDMKLPRFKRFDAQFEKHNYIKRELDINEYDSLYNLIYDPKEDAKVFWVYCKKESSFDKLNTAFK